MKVTINREDLVNVATTAHKAVNSGRNILPLYECFFIEFNKELSYISAQNGEFQIRGSFRCQVEVEFKVLIPADRFLNTIRLINDPEITIQFHEKNGLFSTIIKAGKSRYRINSYNPADWNYMKIEEESEKVVIPGFFLFDKLRKASSVLDEKNMSQVFHQVAIQKVGDEIHINGCFNHLWYRGKLKNDREEFDDILLHKIFSTMIGQINSESDIEIISGEKFMHFNVGVFSFTARKMDNKYPNVLAIQNKRPINFIVVNRYELEMALKRISYYTESDKNALAVGSADIEISPMIIKIEGNQTMQNNRGVEEIDIDYKSSDYTLLTGLNVRSLIHIVTRIDTEKLKIYFNNDDSTGIFVIPGDENTAEKELWMLGKVKRNKDESEPTVTE